VRGDVQYSVASLQVQDISIIGRATSITCSIGGCRFTFHVHIEWIWIIFSSTLGMRYRQLNMWWQNWDVDLQSWRETPASQSLKLVMKCWWPCNWIEFYNKVYVVWLPCNWIEFYNKVSVVWLWCNSSNFHNTDYGVRLPQFHQVPNNQMIIITDNVDRFTPTWGCVFCSWRNSPTILSLSRYYYVLFNIIMFFLLVENWVSVSFKDSDLT